MRLQTARKLLVLEFLDKDICLFIVATIFGRLLRDVHFVIIQFAFKILQNELFSVIFVLQSFKIGLHILDLLRLVHSLLFEDLILQQQITGKNLVLAAHFLHLSVQLLRFLVQLTDDIIRSVIIRLDIFLFSRRHIH